MTGAAPVEVDHRDMNGLNNRWANLRPLHPQPKQNEPRMAARAPRSRQRACRFTHTGRRYRARIKVMGVERHLGCFATPEEAHAVYMEAAREHFGGFVHA